MSRRSWVLGAVVFISTLMLNTPAAFLARFVPWSPAWQPVAVTGTLWNGRMDRLGALGPLVWRVQPWFGQATLSAGFQQRIWELKVSGWPWAWQAQFEPVASQLTPATGYLLDGQWQGRLQLNGRGARCLSSTGDLQGEDVALLSPWTVVLGNAQLKFECRDGLRFLVDVQQKGEHRFEARLEPDKRQLKISGWVEPDAVVTPLLVQAGMLQAGASQLETVLGKR